MNQPHASSPNTQKDQLLARRVLQDLFEDKRLDFTTARAFLNAVFAQNIHDSQLGAALGILRHRGETPEELAGLLQAMMDHAIPVQYDGALLVDPVGTGGDGLHTYNISTMTAIALAGMDIPVAKHGNRKASSLSGSSDTLECCGVPITADVPTLEKRLRDVGLAFLFAPNHHPVLRHVGPLRREIGTMTTFNLLGPLANPAPVTHQLLGVARPNILEDYAKAAASRGVQAYVVHGDKGADEALPSGEFLLVRGEHGKVECVDPRRYGAIRCTIEALQGGTSEQNAQMLWNVLRGEGPEAVTHAVALNVALMLELIGRAQSPKDAFEEALAGIQSGKGAKKLEQYIRALS